MIIVSNTSPISNLIIIDKISRDCSLIAGALTESWHHTPSPHDCLATVRSRVSVLGNFLTTPTSVPQSTAWLDPRGSFDIRLICRAHMTVEHKSQAIDYDCPLVSLDLLKAIDPGCRPPCSPKRTD